MALTSPVWKRLESTHPAEVDQTNPDDYKAGRQVVTTPQRPDAIQLANRKAKLEGKPTGQTYNNQYITYLEETRAIKCMHGKTGHEGCFVCVEMGYRLPPGITLA